MPGELLGEPWEDLPSVSDATTLPKSPFLVAPGAALAVGLAHAALGGPAVLRARVDLCPFPCPLLLLSPSSLVLFIFSIDISFAVSLHLPLLRLLCLLHLMHILLKLGVHHHSIKPFKIIWAFHYNLNIYSKN